MQHWPSESTELERFRFHGRSFAIPQNYQPHHHIYGGSIQSFLVEVKALLPDFAPYTRARRKEWLWPGRGSRLMTIWANDDPQRRSIRERLDDDLRHAIDPNGQSTPIGLRRIQIRKTHSTYFDVVYLPEQDTDVEYIGCFVAEGAMRHCRMYVDYVETAEIHVRFHSDQLGDWERIATGARRLFDSFEIQ